MFMEATHHILILELRIRGVVVDDGEEWGFSWEKSNHVVVGGWMDIADLFFQAIFSQDHHFVFEDITIVLLQ